MRTLKLQSAPVGNNPSTTRRNKGHRFVLLHHKIKNKVRLNKGVLEWFETKVRLSE